LVFLCRDTERDGLFVFQEPRAALTLPVPGAELETLDFAGGRLRHLVDAIAGLLASDATIIYVCGLRGMEDGVMNARQSAAESHGIVWADLHRRLKTEGRLHLETY